MLLKSFLNKQSNNYWIRFSYDQNNYADSEGWLQGTQHWKTLCLFVFQDLFIVSRSYVKNFSSSFCQIRDEALVTVVRKREITKNTASLMRKTRLLTTPSFSLLSYLTRKVKEKYWTVPGHPRKVSLRIWMEKKLKKMVKITAKQSPCLIYGEYKSLTSVK